MKINFRINPLKIESFLKNCQIGLMKKAKRFPFTEHENIIIRQSVKLYGEDWDLISKKLPGRTPKQIHDRYVNYLKDGLISGPWTSQEDEILLSMYKDIGPKWSKMIKNLPGRSGNDIKNRWHKHLSKKFFGLSKKSNNDSSNNLFKDEININNLIFPDENDQNLIQSISNDDILNKSEIFDSAFNLYDQKFPQFSGMKEPSTNSTDVKRNLIGHNNQFVPCNSNFYINITNDCSQYQKQVTLMINQESIPIVKYNNVDIWSNTMKENEFQETKKMNDVNPSIFNHDFEFQEFLEEFNSQNFDFPWMQ